MKEKLYTIPLNDAVNEGDECPFCVIERKLEQDMLDFVLGSCASLHIIAALPSPDACAAKPT